MGTTHAPNRRVDAINICNANPDYRLYWHPLRIPLSTGSPSDAGEGALGLLVYTSELAAKETEF